MKQAFIAFAMADEDEVREGIINDLTPLLAQSGLTPIDSAQAYYKYFPDCGGWKGWIAFICRAVMPMTGEDLFAVMVIPHTTIGKITAQLAQGFLKKNKPVLFYDTVKKSFVGIKEIEEVDSENWKSGWSIILDT